ncbi:MAG: membrane protein insertion efficiency factor YidD [Chlamydiae bacterium]|nr:membrane protein insertion efficiency factor YidD [Chlamydiota bacterium]
MLKSIFIYAVRAYQIFLSPFFGTSCRFYPSCSNYSILAFKKYGALKGLFLTCKRILKCHPYHKGGIDFP